MQIYKTNKIKNNKRKERKKAMNCYCLLVFCCCNSLHWTFILLTINSLILPSRNALYLHSEWNQEPSSLPFTLELHRTTETSTVLSSHDKKSNSERRKVNVHMRVGTQITGSMLGTNTHLHFHTIHSLSMPVTRSSPWHWLQRCHKDGDTSLTTETSVIHNDLLICITPHSSRSKSLQAEDCLFVLKRADQIRQRWRHPRCFISPIVPHVRLVVRSQASRLSVCLKETSNHVCCCWGECVNIRKTCTNPMWNWDAAGQLCELKWN